MPNWARNRRIGDDQKRQYWLLSTSLTRLSFTPVSSHRISVGPGAVLSGTNFTLRGYVDDPTATIHATITAPDGTNTEADADMERDGLFWVDNLPLAAGGSNVITLAMTNAAGVGRVETITVTKSSVELNITDAPTTHPVATVRGTISAPGYTVWVNGRKATNNADGSWVAQRVPTTAGGTATFEAMAIPNTDNSGNGSGAGSLLNVPENVNNANPSSAGTVLYRQDIERGPEIYVTSYDMSDVTSEDGPCPRGNLLVNTDNQTPTHSRTRNRCFLSR